MHGVPCLIVPSISLSSPTPHHRGISHACHRPQRRNPDCRIQGLLPNANIMTRDSDSRAQQSAGVARQSRPCCDWLDQLQGWCVYIRSDSSDLGTVTKDYNSCISRPNVSPTLWSRVGLGLGQCSNPVFTNKHARTRMRSRLASSTAVRCITLFVKEMSYWNFYPLSRSPPVQDNFQCSRH